jgi:hypothetical protein
MQSGGKSTAIQMLLYKIKLMLYSDINDRYPE